MSKPNDWNSPNFSMHKSYSGSLNQNYSGKMSLPGKKDENSNQNQKSDDKQEKNDKPNSPQDELQIIGEMQNLLNQKSLELEDIIKEVEILKDQNLHPLVDINRKNIQDLKEKISNSLSEINFSSANEISESILQMEQLSDYTTI